MEPRITRAQYQDAMDASDAIASAADLIMKASQLLDRVPSRFMIEVEAVDNVEAIGKTLAFDLNKLADRIALDADHAAEDDA